MGRLNVVLLVAVFAACTALLDTRFDQCRTDDDCSEAFKEGEWACQTRVCVRRDCAKNADCAPQDGGPSRCIDSRCRPLLTSDCNRILPEPEDDKLADNAVVLGAFAPPGVTSLEYRNYQLAIEELNSDPLIPENRPVSLVVCDKPASDDEDSLGGFRHLNDTQRVPGIIADVGGDVLRTLLLEYNGRQLFFLVPSSSDGSVVVLGNPDGGLVQYLLASNVEYAEPFVPLLELALGHVATQHENDHPRVAIVKSDSGSGAEMWKKLERILTIQGTRLEDTDPDRVETLDVSGDSLLEDLVSFVPDVVLGTADEFPFLVDVIELLWSEENPDRPRPFYVLPPWGAFDMFQLSAELTSSEERVQRLVGINAATYESPVLDEYQRRFEERFHETPNGENYYDAVYYLAYAALRASTWRNIPLTGPGLAEGFQYLLSGPDVPVGPEGKEEAFRELSAGRSIELMGTLGPPEFDRATGTRKGSGSVYCFVEENGGAVVRHDVLLYEKVTGKLEANPKEEFCFAGFWPSQSDTAD